MGDKIFVNIIGKFRNMNRSKKIFYGLLIGIFATFLLGIFGFDIYIVNQNHSDTVAVKTYDKHFCFISDEDDDGELWKSIYQSAQAYGEKNGIYVEWFGENLVEDFSKTELMQMAIAAKVDGIIVDGDDTEELNNLINEAETNHIPVVTVVKDCYGSYRNAFVGMSAYNLGQEYANMIFEKKSKEDQSVLVIINLGDNDSDEKLTYAGIKETLLASSNDNITVSTLAVHGDSSYSSEESIRTLLLEEEEQPDIIVCLDEQTTESVSQLVVDYNRVGMSKILGFYDSKVILEAIEHTILDATITIDTNQIGIQSVQALVNYDETGYVSDYIPIDIKQISSENVNDFLSTEAGQDE